MPIINEKIISRKTHGGRGRIEILYSEGTESKTSGLHVTYQGPALHLKSVERIIKDLLHLVSQPKLEIKLLDATQKRQKR